MVVARAALTSDPQHPGPTPRRRITRDPSRIFSAALLIALGSWMTPRAHAQPDLRGTQPLVRADFRSGALPASATSRIAAATLASGGVDSSQELSPSWLNGATLPDLPVRLHPQVLRYLDYFREDPRGQRLMRGWLERAGRYGEMIQRELSAQGVPEDLRCVALAESGFDPTVRSNRGAAGMWQFVTSTGAEYGLHVDRWVDERLDPVRATRAAAQMFTDMYRRLGSWELALAAYNMGFGALLRSIRKYNTNDYWTLAELEAGLPFETTHYVAKIVACAVVMRNPALFGYGDIQAHAALESEAFEVSGGVNLTRLARLAGVSSELMIQLNPHLRRRRTPPGRANTLIRIPAGMASTFAQAWNRVSRDPVAEQPYLIRFGESLSEVAARYRTSVAALRELNGAEDGEDLGAGTVIFVPAVEPLPQSEAIPSEELPVVAVPSIEAPAGRERFFYEVRAEDTIRGIARAFEVSPEELARWNQLDVHARIHSGMYMQVFVRDPQISARVLVLREDQVRLVTVGTEEFYDDHETRQGRVRFRYRIAEGDSLSSISRRFGLSVGSIARINQIGRRTTLSVGQEIILYAEESRVPARLRPSAENAAAGEDQADADEAAEEAADDAAADEADELDDETAAGGSELDGDELDGDELDGDELASDALESDAMDAESSADPDEIQGAPLADPH